MHQERMRAMLARCPSLRWIVEKTLEAARRQHPRGLALKLLDLNFLRQGVTADGKSTAFGRWHKDVHLAPPADSQFSSSSADDCHCAVTMPLRVTTGAGRAAESATSGVAFYGPGRADLPEPPPVKISRSIFTHLECGHRPSQAPNSADRISAPLN